jgi:MFS superfamily sulfate permease-like transporter
MTQPAGTDKGMSAWSGALRGTHADILAGVTVAFVTLPICLASGVLAFAPFGPEYAATGAAAGLTGAVYGGILTAIASRSSPVSSSPRTSVAFVYASLATALAGNSVVAHDPSWLLSAMALCVLLAGLWQVLFGAIGVARIIRFTPHPVLAGFLNGVAALIILAQLKPFLSWPVAFAGLPSLDNMASLALVVLVAASVLSFGVLTRKIPALATGFLVGGACFYAAGIIAPDVDLGPTLGHLTVGRAPDNFLTTLLDSGFQQAIAGNLPDIAVVSLAVAVIATFDSLLTFRAAENVSDIASEPGRNVIAQGIGNCAAALAGGLPVAASPSQTIAAINAGGRTRLVGIAAAALLLTATIAIPNILAAIPIAVLSGLLLAIGVQLFDRWSVRLLYEAFKRGASADRRRTWHDLLVVLTVMAVTASMSVIAGIIAGFALAGIIFIINMSRPIVRRRYSGLSSKRFRTEVETGILTRSASRRVVLELEGVLFFGNADDLSRQITGILTGADMIALDLRGVSDIDVSGETVLQNLCQRTARRNKTLLFCNVPAAHVSQIRRVIEPAGMPPIFPDLDFTLEWMEDAGLRKECPADQRTGIVSFEEHDFTRGLDSRERAILQTYLRGCEFQPGEILCREAEPADRMWLLTKGSVSVRLGVADARRVRRMATLPMGTVTGSMALLGAGAFALADIVADEHVMAYELDRSAFDDILRDHPLLAAKMLRNVGRELSRRLRTTFDDFRPTTS